MTEENVLYEDNHILVVNKSAGIMTQSDYRGEKSLQDGFKDYLKLKYSKPGQVYLGIVQRLDRPVSGAVIFAKTSKAAERLTDMMKERSILKLYTAVTINNPASISADFQRKDFFLEREKDISYVAKSGEKASHSYKTILKSSSSLLHLLMLNTGRKHQIRAFFSSLKSPIIFDSKYGYPEKRSYILLHACHTSFIHPVKKEPVSIDAPFPAYFKNFCSKEFQEDYFEAVQSECRTIISDFMGKRIDR